MLRCLGMPPPQPSAILASALAARAALRSYQPRPYDGTPSGGGARGGGAVERAFWTGLAALSSQGCMRGVMGRASYENHGPCVDDAYHDCVLRAVSSAVVLKGGDRAVWPVGAKQSTDVRACHSHSCVAFARISPLLPHTGTHTHTHGTHTPHILTTPVPPPPPRFTHHHHHYHHHHLPPLSPPQRPPCTHTIVPPPYTHSPARHLLTPPPRSMWLRAGGHSSEQHNRRNLVPRLPLQTHARHRPPGRAAPLRRHDLAAVGQVNEPLPSPFLPTCPPCTLSAPLYQALCQKTRMAIRPTQPNLSRAHLSPISTRIYAAPPSPFPPPLCLHHAPHRRKVHPRPVRHHGALQSIRRAPL